MIQGKHRYDPLLIDIWSVGVVLFAMVCGHLPFCDHDTASLYKKIISGSYKCPQWLSPEVKDLISRMLTLNPKERATIEEIKCHKWYNLTDLRSSYGVDTDIYRVPK